MRIALLADVHGNDVALEAVLADIDGRGGVDAYWILGDLAAIGPSPVGVLERLTALNNARVVRGNTDRYVCTGERPSPSEQQVRENLDLLTALIEVQGSFSWTQGFVTAAGWFDWLADLPLSFTDELPDGTRTLCVHAAPNRDDGEGFEPGTSELDAAEMVEGCEADLICVGHTHQAVDLRVNGKRIVNPGSVAGGPSCIDACYATIEADKTGYDVSLHQVAYNVEEAIADLFRVKHPAAEFINKVMRCDPTIEFS